MIVASHNSSQSYRKKPRIAAVILLILTVNTVAMTTYLPSARGASFPHKDKKVQVLVFSWRERTPYLISLALKNEIWGDFEVPYYNVSVVTKETWATEKSTINYSAYDVIVVDSFLPEDVDEVSEIMKWINGTYASKSLLFFGGGYPELAMEEFSDLLPVDIVAHRPLLNSTLDGIFQNSTGLPDSGFEEFLNYSFNSINEYNNKSNQVEVEVADEANKIRSIFRSPRIAWGSCPLLKQRIQTLGRKVTDALTIVQVPSTKEPIVVEGNITSNTNRNGSQVVYISTGTINPPGDDEWNKPFYLWPYFNYFMYVTLYHLKADVQDSEIQSYADWPYSPIPHERESALWMLFVAGLWIFNFVLFFWLGRKGKKRRAADAEAQTGEGAEGTTSEIPISPGDTAEPDSVSEETKPVGSSDDKPETPENPE